MRAVNHTYPSVRLVEHRYGLSAADIAWIDPQKVIEFPPAVHKFPAVSWPVYLLAPTGARSLRRAPKIIMRARIPKTASVFRNPLRAPDDVRPPPPLTPTRGKRDDDEGPPSPEFRQQAGDPDLPAQMTR